jgi:hypothetical protein
MKFTIGLLALALLGNAAEPKASPKDWSRVTALNSGVTVQVVHHGLKQSIGRLVAATSDELHLDTPSGPLQLARTDVRRVSVRQKSRKKRTLIGAALGAGAGAAIFAIGASSGDIDLRRDIVAVAGAALGAGVGAAIGAATGGLTTVYRAP